MGDTLVGFQETYENLKNNIDQQSDAELIVAISRLLASLGEAHTSLALPDSKLLPFEFIYLDGKVYCIGAASKYKEAVYSQLLSINGVQISNIIAELESVISHENNYWFQDILPIYLTNTTILEGLSVQAHNHAGYSLAFLTQDAKTVNLQVEPIPNRERYADEVIAPAKQRIEYFRRSNEYYWYKIVENEPVLYFAYNQCAEDPQQPMSEFLRSMVGDLETNHIQKIVVDLRNNAGGNSAILKDFIYYLRESPTLQRQGSVVVLIGHETFSSGLLNAIDLKMTAHAVLIGEPTGGKPNSFGDIQTYQLPNSKLTFSYSTKYFNLGMEEDALYPDKFIPLTIQDLMNGTDPVLDAAL